METQYLSQVAQLSETSEGRDFLYRQLYEIVAEATKERFSEFRIATRGDFVKMAPSRDYCLYVHYPYCDSVCRGCLYPKTVRQGSMDAYCESLITEMDIIRDLPSSPRPLYLTECLLIGPKENAA
ncbi:MAG: hypothetical protein QF890_05900 [Myxococcota bacterium]|jgi:coproporphyrinogen III oxidase-like Fe-S oxidoreductase|nr:hypothetical protein [Deltaproteobacteria bacterium]MCP4242705.1 hypothetical protein [bacterium]MDP7297953.1 hypothetical protein [Myxococcota bacterium]MDP7432092.1 hypothetical protein [Myxococcota bacterium]HJO22054.1 hypothetical protein [Myxococcota bacterium]